MDAAANKPQPEDPPKETIIPIIIETGDPSKPPTASTELPSDSSICTMVKQINISSEAGSNGVPETTAAELPDLPERLIPAHNCPERIIVVYDCVNDEDAEEKFKIDGESYVANNVVKRGLKFFLNHKSDVDERHEFATIGLTDSGAVWLKDFTNNVEQVYSVIDDLALTGVEPGEFSLNALFELISDNINISYLANSLNEPPPFIYRVLFTYCRSSLLTFSNLNVKRDFLDSPYFTFDVLITHDKPSENNNCSKNIEFLQKIDSKGYNYVFPVGRSVRDLHLAAAKLLGHPLQRPRQIVANYKIDLDED